MRISRQERWAKRKLASHTMPFCRAGLPVGAKQCSNFRRDDAASPKRRGGGTWEPPAGTFSAIPLPEFEALEISPVFLGVLLGENCQLLRADSAHSAERDGFIASWFRRCQLHAGKLFEQAASIFTSLVLLRCQTNVAEDLVRRDLSRLAHRFWEPEQIKVRDKQIRREGAFALRRSCARRSMLCPVGRTSQAMRFNRVLFFTRWSLRPRAAGRAAHLIFL
jgi:hypothetical protein